jgi:hypothetical protein
MRLAAIAVLVLSLFAPPAHAGQSYFSQQGAWIRNKSESKIPEGANHRDTPMVVMQDDGQNLRYVLFDMTTTGYQAGITFVGAYDGKPYSFGKEATRSYRHLSENSFRSEVKNNDGTSSVETVTFISAVKMRIEGKRTDAAGKSYDYIEVWDKMN